MGNIKLEIHQVGMISTNCYFIINKDTNECIVVDPGDNADGLYEKIMRNGYKPVAIILTHGHFDHILAVNPLERLTKVPVMAYEEEKEMLKDTKPRFTAMVKDNQDLVVEPDRFFKNEEEVTLGGITFKVLHTPGHSSGSCCYYLQEEGILISGDTLFEGSIGRTDFPTGSMQQLDKSLNEVLMKLPDDVEVYPGHGGQTTIGAERKYNPYVR